MSYKIKIITLLAITPLLSSFHLYAMEQSVLDIYEQYCMSYRQPIKEATLRQLNHYISTLNHDDLLEVRKLLLHRYRAERDHLITEWREGELCEFLSEGLGEQWKNLEFNTIKTLLNMLTTRINVCLYVCFQNSSPQQYCTMLPVYRILMQHKDQMYKKQFDTNRVLPLIAAYTGFSPFPNALLKETKDINDTKLGGEATARGPGLFYLSTHAESTASQNTPNQDYFADILVPWNKGPFRSEDLTLLKTLIDRLIV